MNLFSTEQVSRYHPDKYCDQISDALLTAYLQKDKDAHCGIETLVKDKSIVLAGEVNSTATISHKDVALRVAAKLGYDVEYIYDMIGKQSPEINNAVSKETKIGAGDQGMMYGYACRESESLLPYGLHLANKIMAAVEQVTGPVLKGDAKTQVTVDRAIKGPESVHKVLISVCHKEEINLQVLTAYVNDLLDGVFEEEGVGDVERIINPAGAWTIGGPTADAGLTGRKIVCDQYGGYCAVGGGAFSGKDPSKVDRSAAYMAREIACQLVEQENLEWCEIQLAYAIGVPEPVSIHTANDRGLDFSNYVKREYDLTPKGIIKELDLLNKDYEKLAEGCHYRYRMR